MKLLLLPLIFMFMSFVPAKDHRTAYISNVIISHQDNDIPPTQHRASIRVNFSEPLTQDYVLQFRIKFAKPGYPGYEWSNWSWIELDGDEEYEWYGQWYSWTPLSTYATGEYEAHLSPKIE